MTNTNVKLKKWPTAPQSGFESLCGSGFARTGFRNVFPGRGLRLHFCHLRGGLNV